MRVIRAISCRSIKEEASLVERPEAVLTFLGGRYIVRPFWPGAAATGNLVPMKRAAADRRRFNQTQLEFSHARAMPRLLVPISMQPAPVRLARDVSRRCRRRRCRAFATRRVNAGANSAA